MKNHALVLSLVALLGAASAAAQVTGTMTCNGKKTTFTHAYAYLDKGHLDEGKDDVVVVLSDAPIEGEKYRETFELMELEDKGKIHALRLVVNAEKAIISMSIHSKDMTKPVSGAGTNYKLELTSFDGKTIAGKTYTAEPEEFFGDTYEWSCTFTAPIGAKKGK